MIQELTATPELNKTYLGKVQRITDFGAFVEIMPGTDGLLHVSEIANYRVKDVRDELKEGQQVLVKVINIDPTGKIRLSRKALLPPDEGRRRPLGAAKAVRKWRGAPRRRAARRRSREGRDRGRGPRRRTRTVGRRVRGEREAAVHEAHESTTKVQIARLASCFRDVVAFLLAGASSEWRDRVAAQDQAPNRRDITIVARDLQFIPNRIEVVQDDLVRITLTSEDRPLQLRHRRLPHRQARRRRPDHRLRLPRRPGGHLHVLLQSHQRAAVQGHEGHAGGGAEIDQEFQVHKLQVQRVVPNLVGSFETLNFELVT